MPHYLTECVRYLFDNYIQATKGTFANSPVGEYVRNTIPQNILESGLIDKAKYKIKASVGQGIWAQVPWIGIFRNEITDSAQNGVYIVYLLSADCNSIFLTFNQGFTDIAKDKSAKETVDEMRKRASDCILKLNKLSFRSDENISLGNNLTNRAEMYQKGTIFYKEYKKHNLPSEDTLEKDLKDMLGIYEEYYEKIYKRNNIINAPSIPISNEKNMSRNQIFFGAPGTGKSHKIDYDLFKDENGNPVGKGIKEVSENRKFRTTFYPDYDYAQFVGAYKPKKCDDGITYSFVPQVFAKAYATAWRLQLSDETDKNVFLVIEEINRGNCAQIFGDIFQLLDRDVSGASQYSIDADCDFTEWLDKEFKAANLWDAYKKEVGGEGKLKLPPNLNILATMNTSDQSLFPMDSAFKRRFDWEYVPISFDGKDAANFQIDIDGSQYSWQKFVETVNQKILDLTDSEDKQLGEFFIKPDDGMVISKERFLGKVMFYLWNEVCKDEHKNGSFFRTKDDGYFTFQDLYKPEKKDILNRFMAEIGEK